jgi:hypothetical protein
MTTADLLFHFLGARISQIFTQPTTAGDNLIGDFRERYAKKHVNCAIRG